MRGYSREANDLGQIAFALFVAVSVTAATRAGTHLAADLAGAALFGAHARVGLRGSGAALGLLPWALFVLIASRHAGLVQRCASSKLSRTPAIPAIS